MTPPVTRTEGHKCLGAVMKFETYCECGWNSCSHSVKDGGRAAAYSEWRAHVRSHAATAIRATVGEVGNG